MRFEIARCADLSDGPEMTTARVTYSCEIPRKEWPINSRTENSSTPAANAASL